jgi:hypothetical protein
MSLFWRIRSQPAEDVNLEEVDLTPKNGAKKENEQVKEENDELVNETVEETVLLSVGP